MIYVLCLCLSFSVQFTLLMTALVKTIMPTTTAMKFCINIKHVLFFSFSAPTGFS